MLLPCPAVLAAQAAGGAAIALERVETKQVSRRGLLRITFWAGLGRRLSWHRRQHRRHALPARHHRLRWRRLGRQLDQFRRQQTQVPEGRFWIVNLTAEQGGPGYLALWWKCPHWAAPSRGVLSSRSPTRRRRVSAAGSAARATALPQRCGRPRVWTGSALDGPLRGDDRQQPAQR